MALVHCPLPKSYSNLVTKKLYKRVFQKMMMADEFTSTIRRVPTKENVFAAGQRADDKVREFVELERKMGGIKSAEELINKYVGYKPKVKVEKEPISNAKAAELTYNLKKMGDFPEKYRDLHKVARFRYMEPAKLDKFSNRGEGFIDPDVLLQNEKMEIIKTITRTDKPNEILVQRSIKAIKFEQDEKKRALRRAK